MSIVLKAKLLTKVPERERGGSMWLELMAAICPAAQRQELRQQLSEFDQSQTVTSFAILDILNGMENNRGHV
jgi:hypothetical protein